MYYITTVKVLLRHDKSRGNMIPILSKRVLNINELQNEIDRMTPKDYIVTDIISFCEITEENAVILGIIKK
jgi:hypothetical protein